MVSSRFSLQSQWLRSVSPNDLRRYDFGYGLETGYTLKLSMIHVIGTIYLLGEVVALPEHHHTLLTWHRADC